VKLLPLLVESNTNIYISAELVGVPNLLVSNVDTINNDQSSKELWVIMKHIDDETLAEYIKRNKPNLREALHITRQLLTIVKDVHARRVVHRNLQPKNILVNERSDIDRVASSSDIDEISLTVVNFDSSWIDDYQWANIVDDTNIQLGNDFYRMSQFEKRLNENNQQQQSPTIDVTGVCAILFWMITDREPKESRDINETAPHYLPINAKMIEKKVTEIIGKVRSLGKL
jgi:serine/threonine protein kinase